MPKKALFVEEKFYRKAKFWRTIIAILFLLGFILAFWDEIRLLIAPYWPIDGGSPAEASDLAIAKLAYNFIGLVAMFFIWVLITSQFVLPVRSGERWLVFQRLLRYFGRFHGPAVFIEKGISIADEGEMHNTRPGVAFVDLCSAIVLEQQWEHVETGKDIFTQLRKTHAYKMMIKAFKAGKKKVVDGLWRLAGQQPPVEPLARVEGPGIVFTRMQEKIRGIADLRQQSRKIEARVTTRDGFEIQVPVGVKFSIGEKPEILLVTYAGEGSDGQVIASPDTIRVIKLNEARNKIKGIEEELDAADRLEIHKYVTSHQPIEGGREELEVGHDNPPYHFDPDRVFAALYSQAKEAKESTPLDWTELPVHVAVEVLRDLISAEDYDALYRLDNPQEYPLLDRVLPEFKLILRNAGVLAYRFVSRKDGKALNVGDNWIRRELNFYERQDFKTSKVLRDRGIRILTSGFTELTPKHPGVREQLVDHWRARWEGEANEIASKAEMEAINIIANTRRVTYREMINNLEMIYAGTTVPKDALAIRLFQALEQAMEDPDTQALMPRDALAFLWDLRQYLSDPHAGSNMPNPWRIQ